MTATPPADRPTSPTREGQHRRVELTRTGPGTLRAINGRGTTLDLGTGETDDFTPVELLLVALAGCGALDVDAITAKRSEPDQFDVVAEADKVRNGEGNHLVGITVDFRVTFPDTVGGRNAESVLTRSIEMARQRLCTVSRTVELGTPVRPLLRGNDLPPHER